MDEPFAALDAQMRQLMGAELLRLWAEDRKTILFVTHDLDEAIYLADRVVVLSASPGRILDVVPVDLPRPRALAIRSSAAFGVPPGAASGSAWSARWSGAWRGAERRTDQWAG